MDEGSAPPGDQEDQRKRGHQRHDDREPELARDPAAAGDALRPVQPVGAVLEPEDERGSQQDADQAGDEREPGDEVAALLESRGERSERLATGLGRARGEARGEPVVAVGGCHLDAGRDEQRREDSEDPECEQRLGALLAPADPDHVATASRGERSIAVCAFPYPM